MKELKLSKFEVDVIGHVMNAPSQRGSTIKDLRLLHNTIKGIEKQIPEPPSPPVLPELKDKEKHDEATIEKHKVSEKEYNEQMKRYNEAEYSIKIEDTQYNIVKVKLSSFNQFYEHPQQREKIIRLGEKFGI